MLTVHFNCLSEAPVRSLKIKSFNINKDITRNKILLVFSFSFFFLIQAYTQQHLLNKNISITVSQKKIPQVLQQISHEGNFYFSYDSHIVNGDTLVSVKATNTTVREILDKIFAGSMDYIENGNYIILRKRLQAAVSAPYVKTYVIQGVVKDMNTGMGVQDASVYEKTNLSATLTSNDGAFTLKLKTKSTRPLISVSKQNYYDTGLYVPLPANRNIVVQIQNKLSPLVDTGAIIIISPRELSPIVIPDSTFILTKSAGLTV